MITQESYQSEQQNISFRGQKFALFIFIFYINICQNLHKQALTYSIPRPLIIYVNIEINNKDRESKKNRRLFIITTTYQIILCSSHI